MKIFLALLAVCAPLLDAHAAGRAVARPLFTQAARGFSLAPAPRLVQAVAALETAGVPAYIAPESYPDERWHLYIPSESLLFGKKVLARESLALEAADVRAAPPAHAPEALVELLEAVSATRERHPIVLFDIDDTLADTGGRHRRIIKEFLARPDIKAAYPEYSARLERFLAQNEPHFSVRDTARAAGVEGDHFIAELVEFWKPRFFNNGYLSDDSPIPGAAAYVRALKERGARIVYVTGRSEELRPGSVAALEALGLPVPDGKDVFLLLKQDKSEKDYVYKDRVLKDVATWGLVVGGFENEPQNVNVFKRHFPDANMIFLDTKHSNPRDPATGEPVQVDQRVRWVKDYSLPPTRS